MDMMLPARPVKKPGDEIIFFGQAFLADRAAAGQSCLAVRVTVRASEYMAESVLFTGIESCFYLFSIDERCLAYRADAGRFLF
jgi:hypothetical protein